MHVRFKNSRVNRPTGGFHACSIALQDSCKHGSYLFNFPSISFQRIFRFEDRSRRPVRCRYQYISGVAHTPNGLSSFLSLFTQYFTVWRQQWWVLKSRFRSNQPQTGDRKCPAESRKSLVGQRYSFVFETDRT